MTTWAIPVWTLCADTTDTSDIVAGLKEFHVPLDSPFWEAQDYAPKSTATSRTRSDPESHRWLPPSCSPCQSPSSPSPSPITGGEAREASRQPDAELQQDSAPPDAQPYEARPSCLDEASPPSSFFLASPPPPPPAVLLTAAQRQRIQENRAAARERRLRRRTPWSFASILWPTEGP